MTTTTTTPTGSAPDSRLTLPRVATRGGSGIAPLRGNGAANLQLVLFVGGAVMLPLGLVVIILGWYGASNTPYQYDQLSYLVSGGLFGLGLTFCGGFLYFGAWLARIAADQKESAKRLSETLLVLADVVSASGATGRHSSAAPAAMRDPGSVLVVAAAGSTVHRADCALIAGRADVVPAGPDGASLNPCRVCRPGS